LQEGLLDQIVDLALGLVLEEPVQRCEVTLEQDIASVRITGAPAIE